eukprot:GEMP01067963.1.p1 GENE.GEMP01067963.1~~GEMP01067963.1.p1  ORF type:complete len:191 (+),score=21.78 GEMP01067963.1:232-804(+)
MCRAVNLASLHLESPKSYLASRTSCGFARCGWLREEVSGSHTTQKPCRFPKLRDIKCPRRILLKSARRLFTTPCLDTIKPLVPKTYSSRVCAPSIHEAMLGYNKAIGHFEKDKFPTIQERKFTHVSLDETSNLWTTDFHWNFGANSFSSAREVHMFTQGNCIWRTHTHLMSDFEGLPPGRIVRTRPMAFK